MVRFYRLDDNVEVSLDYVTSLGVLYWAIDPINHEKDGKLAAIRKERGYTYHDIITVSPQTLPNYETKIKSFFEEHLHKDEEIRFFLEGSGYFDVRGQNDEWIRIHAFAGDMITLPAGIYHRFSTDSKNYAKVMRLFQGEPVWTPFNRDASIDKCTERLKYTDVYLCDISSVMSKVGISSPTNWQDIMGNLKKPTFVFFRSKTNPETGVPSEVPCQRAVPILKSVLSHAITKPFTFVDCEVDPKCLQNPDHPYVTDEQIKLKVLPTLLFWGQSTRLEAEQLHDDGVVLNYVKKVFPQ